VVRWAPRPPVPFDARHPAHGDCRPPPSWVAGVSQLAWRRLLRYTRLWHRGGFTCSGLGSLRRPFSPSADCCPPLGKPLSLPSLRQVNSSPRVRRVTFHPSPPHIHRLVPDDIGLRPPTLPHPRCDASHAVRVPRVGRLPAASFRSHLTMGTLAVRLGVPVIKASKGLAPSSHFPVGFRLPVASACHGAARHAWRTSG
jgi:hypothetical protein